MEVHLVGVDHTEQYCKAGKPLHRPLANYLITYCKRIAITVIAEEFSEEALQFSSAASPNGSVAWSVGVLLKIKHAFCDPNSEARAQLGIPTKRDIIKTLGLPAFTITKQETNELDNLINNEQAKYWHIRERYWLSELVKINAHRVLFVVGKMHVQRFRLLLEQNSISVVIANDSWNP